MRDTPGSAATSEVQGKRPLRTSWDIYLTLSAGPYVVSFFRHHRDEAGERADSGQGCASSFRLSAYKLSPCISGKNYTCLLSCRQEGKHVYTRGSDYA